MQNVTPQHPQSELYRLCKLYDPPTYVKSASYEDLNVGPQSVGNHHLFGDPRYLDYPCHTAAATWLSTARLYDSGRQQRTDDFNFINTRLDRAANFHKIAEDCDALRTRIEQSQQAPIDRYALTYALPNGEQCQHLPIRNKAEVIQAGMYFCKYAQEFTWSDKNQIANNILDAAEQYGLRLAEEEFLKKYAARGFCTATKAASLLRERALLAKNHPEETLFQKAAEAFENDSSLARNTKFCVKLAGIIEEADKKIGIKAYDRKLQSPADMFFSLTKEAIAETIAQHVSLNNGSIFKLADIQSIPVSTIRDYFGDDMVEAVSFGGVLLDGEKLAAVIPTLPLPDANLFENLLRAQGVKPVAKEASRGFPRLTDNMVYDLANDWDSCKDTTGKLCT